MTPDLEVTADGDVVVARLSRDVDMATTPAISSRLVGALGNDTAGLVVDLTSVRYVDSAGIHLLFDLARRLEAGRQGMAVVADDGSPARRLLEMTGLAQAVALCRSYDEGVRAVRAGARRPY